MWNKISNSSIIFSKNYYKTKNENFYQNSIFINKVYYYYNNKGYLNILLNQIINIFISIFTIFFLIFLINCVDYKNIINLNENKYIYEFINIDNFFKINSFVLLSLVIFFLIIINKIINIIDDSIVYKHIKNYYNINLKIKDEDLNYLEWNTIVNKIKENMDNNIYYINNIITAKENYLISLFDNDIIQINHLTSIMEWNLIYCILFSIFDSEFKIKGEIFGDKKKICKSIDFMMKFISIINFIFMPFIVTFILLYNIFNYGEYYYNNPSLIFSRTFTRKSKWLLRYYNELDHEFDKRINEASIHANNYTKLFNQNITNIFFRFIIFICSSIFIVLVILSLINDKILINLLLTKNQSVLWFIGILASIITILRKSSSNSEKPEKHIKILNKYIKLDQNIINNPNLLTSKKKITKIFEYKFISLIKDFIYILVSPFELWNLSYDIESIVDFIIDNTINHDKLIYICKYSNFEDIFMENIDDISNIDKYNESKDENVDVKSKISLLNFCDKYPSWIDYMHKKLNYGSINIKIM